MNLFKNTYLVLVAIAVFSTSLFTSCDDSTDSLGASLTNVVDKVNIVDTATYYVSSSTVAATNVISRTRNGYLGKIKDPETGDYVTCNYMTQFRSMGKYEFSPLDSIQIDNYDESRPKYQQIVADSCSVVFYIESYIGDSLALMKVTAHELDTPYEESQMASYTTEFDPEKEGMIRTGAGSIHTQMAYTTSNRVHSDSQRESSSYSNRISLSLNKAYTDKNGDTYNNYGTYLMRKYFTNNEDTANYFYNNYNFQHHICPGLYLKSENGLGNVASIYSSQIIVYYRGWSNDSLYNLTSSFAGTEEVIQKTNIQQNSNKLKELEEDGSCTYLKTPAGLFTELTLPVEDIINGHTDDDGNVIDTLSTVRMFIPRINNEKVSDYALSVPQTLLLVLTDSLENFFANKEVADYRNSYLTTYSSSTNGYTFGNISLLISNLYNIKKDYESRGETLSENWNKVVLVPVETTYTTVSTTTSTLTKVTHDLSFASTKLKKGTEENKNIQLNVIYSKFEE